MHQHLRGRDLCLNQHHAVAVRRTVVDCKRHRRSRLGTLRKLQVAGEGYYWNSENPINRLEPKRNRIALGPASRPASAGRVGLRGRRPSPPSRLGHTSNNDDWKTTNDSCGSNVAWENSVLCDVLSARANSCEGPFGWLRLCCASTNERIAQRLPAAVGG
jgi:hypothetical protein